eukprot:TRINITY_DN2760_c0_g1_i1.p4 TRINITY_DN2760_c0_g1~~TRINITY_DN2760_c0_g1_i1.p4  ORF type:complete len:165 (+),score=22.70 TRINITY_DN2760_c0_g1_i1:33-527(+)
MQDRSKKRGGKDRKRVEQIAPKIRKGKRKQRLALGRKYSSLLLLAEVALRSEKEDSGFRKLLTQLEDVNIPPLFQKGQEERLISENSEASYIVPDNGVKQVVQGYPLHLQSYAPVLGVPFTYQQLHGFQKMLQYISPASPQFCTTSFPFLQCPLIGKASRDIGQ